MSAFNDASISSKCSWAARMCARCVLGDIGALRLRDADAETAAACCFDAKRTDFDEGGWMVSFLGFGFDLRVSATPTSVSFVALRASFVLLRLAITCEVEIGL